MLRKAIKHVDDSSFHLAVEPAATALQQAKVDWSCQQVNILAFDKCEELVQECFPSGDFNIHSFVSISSDICHSYHSISEIECHDKLLIHCIKL